MTVDEYYVYKLIDPRNKFTFYIGKGKGDRVYAHVRDALKNYNGIDYRTIENNGEFEDESTAKISLIRQIHAEGLEVEAIIHRRGLDEKTAYEVEAALIDATPGLTNIQRGHDSRQRGPIIINGPVPSKKPATRIIKTNPIQSSADILDTITEFKHKCIIIKIQQKRVDKNKGDILKTVQRCWNNSKDNAEKSDYVLAVINGIVKGIYKPTDWYYTFEEKCKTDNCEKLKLCLKKSRIGFKGYELTDSDIKSLYLNKRIPDEYKTPGIRSPFLYTY